MFDQKLQKSAIFHCGKKVMRFKIILDLNRGGEIHSGMRCHSGGGGDGEYYGTTSYLRVVPIRRQRTFIRTNSWVPKEYECECLSIEVGK